MVFLRRNPFSVWQKRFVFTQIQNYIGAVKAPNNTVGELERSYRLEDNIIKFLTIHLEKELVPRRPLEATAQEADGGRI